MSPRRFFRWLFDFAALYAVSQLVYRDHGLGWSLVAAGLTLAYGLWCFVDGLMSGNP